VFTKRAFWIGVVIAFTMGGAGGVMLGTYRGFKSGASLVLNGALMKDGRDVAGRIETIALIRAGKTKAAVEKLEKGIDELLAMMDADYPGLEARTLQSRADAVAAATAYRAALPKR
jgi:hypothetical protein